ncbi:MAG: hypothetical protein Q4A28_07690 [Brachymonas sp.]|nr:hypothetical protein [Brachymonas sp.]MDO4795800.1 hypothetical protein [Brachymonas sp.]
MKDDAVGRAKLKTSFNLIHKKDNFHVIACRRFTHQPGTPESAWLPGKALLKQPFHGKATRYDFEATARFAAFRHCFLAASQVVLSQTKTLIFQRSYQS